MHDNNFTMLYTVMMGNVGRKPKTKRDLADAY